MVELGSGETRVRSAGQGALMELAIAARTSLKPVLAGLTVPDTRISPAEFVAATTEPIRLTAKACGVSQPLALRREMRASLLKLLDVGCRIQAATAPSLWRTKAWTPRTSNEGLASMTWSVAPHAPATLRTFMRTVSENS